MFLIGLTFIDENDDLIEQYQTHGIVEKLQNNALLIIKRKDGSLFQFPYDSKTIKKAKPGDYREQKTGEIISNPDFITTWEISTSKIDNLEDIKNHGFIQNK